MLEGGHVSASLFGQELRLTLCPIRNLVVGLLVGMRALRLHANVPDSGDEDGYRDETVSSSTPEVLDQEVFCPFVRYPDLWCRLVNPFHAIRG